VLALTRDDVRHLVPMPKAIELMKLAFAELSAGRAESPLRSVIPVKAGSDTLLMPAYVPAAHALGFKVVSVFPGNLARGKPTINAMVCLLDDQTGEPLAIMDGTYLTALRTGAVSGAATDLMARTDAKRLVVFGAGAQGVTQAAAVCAVRPIERITVVDPSEAAHERYRQAIARDWPDLAERVEVRIDAGDAVRQADVICTATTAKSPVFADADVQPGTHINGIGAFTPAMQELPPETIARALVVVDQVEAALAEAGDLIKPLEAGTVSRDHFQRELGQLASGEVNGRADDRQVTLFKSVGNAVQDVTVAQWAVSQALARAIGTSIDLG
jgi:ornithine cyclodeaminase